MSEDSKIIPINKKLIDSMLKLLSNLKKDWESAPKEFNAIFIDRKGFMKMDKIPFPPRPIICFAVPPKFEFRASNIAQVSTAPTTERNEFHFYRIIGETAEYREY